MREASQPAPRTWLFVPAHQPDRIAKALASAAETVIVDLEDAVPADQRAAARQTLVDALRMIKTHKRWHVRVHGADDEACEADVRAAVAAGAAGIVLAKTQRPGDVSRVADMLRGCDRPIDIVPLIESPGGLLDAPAIAAASEHVTALMLGAEDLALGLGPYVGRGGADPGSGGRDMVHARWMLSLAAAARGVAAIDKVCLAVDDEPALSRECEEACELGFSGKALIHPRQIAVAHRVFQPGPQQVAWARRVMEAAEHAARQGTAAVLLDGRLVDRPVVERARQTVALSEHFSVPQQPHSENRS